MISTDKNFLFIHLQRTAGNSITQALIDYADDEIKKRKNQKNKHRFGLKNKLHRRIKKHTKLSEYKKYLDKGLYDRLFKFSIFRNPWDRMVSIYFAPYQDRSEFDEKKFKNLIQGHQPIAKSVATPNRPLGKELDFILRFEQLQEDFDKLCEILDIPQNKLQHLNYGKHKHYTKYYDTELKKLVGNRFKSEIEFMQYKFEE